MSEKTFKIVGDDISDGYHTFGELYDHRCLLWIMLLLQMHHVSRYWVRNHYPGWDLMVFHSRVGQISYHIPEKFRLLYETKIRECAESAHTYDGHTSADVLKRLEALIS